MKKETELNNSLKDPRRLVNYLELSLTQNDIRSALCRLSDSASEMQTAYNNPTYFLVKKARTRQDDIAVLTQKLLALITPAEEMILENGLLAFLNVAEFVQKGNWESTSANTRLVRNFLAKSLHLDDSQQDIVTKTLKEHADTIRSYILERRGVCDGQYQRIWELRVRHYHQQMSSSRAPVIKLSSDSDLSLEELLLQNNTHGATISSSADAIMVSKGRGEIEKDALSDPEAKDKPIPSSHNNGRLDQSQTLATLKEILGQQIEEEGAESKEAQKTIDPTLETVTDDSDNKLRSSREFPLAPQAILAMTNCVDADPQPVTAVIEPEERRSPSPDEEDYQDARSSFSDDSDEGHPEEERAQDKNLGQEQGEGPVLLLKKLRDKDAVAFIGGEARELRDDTLRHDDLNVEEAKEVVAVNVGDVDKLHMKNAAKDDKKPESKPAKKLILNQFDKDREDRVSLFALLFLGLAVLGVAVIASKAKNN